MMIIKLRMGASGAVGIDLDSLNTSISKINVERDVS